MTFHDLGSVMEGPLAQQFKADRNKHRKYFLAADSIEQIKKKQHFEPTGPNYNPCIEHASDMGPGYIAVIWSDDGPGMFGTASGKDCELWVHADANKKVDAFYMSGTAVDVLFQAWDMNAQAFYQTFISAYGIPELHTQEQLTQNYGNPDHPIPMASGYFESPDGWRIDFQEKSFTMKAVTTTANRFN